MLAEIVVVVETMAGNRKKLMLLALAGIAVVLKMSERSLLMLRLAGRAVVMLLLAVVMLLLAVVMLLLAVVMLVLAGITVHGVRELREVDSSGIQYVRELREIGELVGWGSNSSKKDVS